uniref:Putative secreted protein n=1 Tax=Anopheles marajoara TaxID=58244 RepID=A0A2M4C830_9DIPT
MPPISCYRCKSDLPSVCVLVAAASDTLAATLEINSLGLNHFRRSVTVTQQDDARRGYCCSRRRLLRNGPVSGGLVRKNGFSISRSPSFRSPQSQSPSARSVNGSSQHGA